MIAYKVVRDSYMDDSFLTSCVVEGKLQQVYIPNVATECRVGGFLVFGTLNHAREFLRRWDFESEQFPIWKCEAEDQVNLPAYRFTNDFDLHEHAEALWQGELDVYDIVKYFWVCRAEWPKGTFAYKRVTLLEKAG